MTYANYIVKFGDIGGVTDITSRVLGMQISHACRIGMMPAATAYLTVDNNDGALTPNIGGTYSNVDWFTQAIFIDKGSSSYPLFHGIIDDFVITDDGTNSTVTFSCLDSYTVGGRGPLEDGVSGDDTRTHKFLETLYNGWSLGSVVLRPPAGLLNLAGAGTPTANVDVLSRAGGGPKATPNLPTFNVSLQPQDGTVKDIVNSQLLISYDVVAWPTTIDISAADAVHNSSFVYQLTRDTPTVYNFGPSNIPISTLDVQYRTDELYNSASVTNYEPSTATAEDTTSIAKYGPRNITMTSTLGSSVLFDDSGPVQQDAEIYTANLYVNRFSQSRYFPIQMTVNLESAEAAGIAEATMHNLLSCTNGLWQIAQITYTPTGAAASQTDTAVIAARTINAVPGRTTVTFDLLPAADYGSFVLDSAVLGVLDENRLG